MLIQVFQNRYNGRVIFQRKWEDYVDGFGNPDGEYWLGKYLLQLKNILLSNQHLHLKHFFVYCFTLDTQVDRFISSPWS